MYEYKSVTLVDFFLDDDVKLRRKEFVVENTDKRVTNFMNLFLNYYASKGWEFDRTHKIDKSLDEAVDHFAKNKSAAFSIFNQILTPVAIAGGYEFYIFKRRIDGKMIQEFGTSPDTAEGLNNSETVKNNQSSVELPKVKEDNAGKPWWANQE